MTITINGDAIDFTLENEKTIGDVIAELKTWLGNTGMLLDGIEIDNQKMALDKNELFKKPIEEVGQLSIEALSIRESRMRQLEIARDLFALLKESAETGNSDTLAELESSYQDLRKILPRLLDEKPNSSVISELGKTLEQNRLTLISSSTTMLALLDDRLKEITDPIGEAKSAMTTLSQLANNLDVVAVNLQTGKGKQAMDSIAELCKILQKFIRCLTWGAGNVGRSGIVDDMNKMFSELEEALIANDTVRIGDLLEYEFKPRLMELPDKMTWDVNSTQ
ncbi:hypothetical protein S1OALGB6SA_2376 [Olavius algarvensis spirochete endosymbiont]|uniref:hypothetical protein n=1 Tax=Olavius algarvensis spirochete endosymbiont TaxID=260710 RepID=UPI000F2B0A20|nr:hypothetical protein [Olavius algarvensis spirochete endosymbiont]CAD7838853.1 MAG: hypothetical protein [Olavius algarvensis spirochete endosymbiont]VDB01274.1 hypothetical protein S1OALGB6SA_2376 [Olavius algarvensis spirochete endosymbiont]